jgi:predicted short-subunit dehydrogenase-like oxidoreductase (DUF2520 family)
MLEHDMPLEQLRIGFIGAGRLAQALAWCLVQHDCRVCAVASRSASSALALAAPLEGCEVASAQQVADACDLVFVTTPDASIEAAVQALAWRPGMGVAHCSGATEVSALGKAAADGALTGGFHPMQTFGDPAAAARSLPGCVITIEAQGALDAVLARLAARLGCTVNALPAGMRGRYHASGGYASQFINVLLAEAVHIWQSWGAGEEEALQALLPLLKGTISAIESAGLDRGMPGPVSRGDTETVARHVQALAQLDGSAVALYRELCRRTVPLAQRAGRISPAVADQIRHELE